MRWRYLASLSAQPLRARQQAGITEQVGPERRLSKQDSGAPAPGSSLDATRPRRRLDRRKGMTKAKIIGVLTGAAALILGVVAAAGSAATGDTVLCKTSGSPCALANQYAANSTFTAGLKTGTKAVLSTNVDTVSCSTSNTTLSNTAQNGSPDPLPGSISNLTFSNNGGPCTDSLGNTCTVTVNGLPYSGGLSIDSPPDGNGTLKVNSPGATVVCGPSGSQVINCTFSATSVSGAFHGGNPAEAVFSNVTLNRSGLICPATSTWSSDYVLNGTNTSVFLESSA
jgi:hypothetical protein